VTIFPTELSSLTGSSTPTSTTTGTNSNPLNQLDNTQTFLQLLVAQLENQDPDNPEDPSTFMTEISQLASVEAQTNLSSEEQVVAADSMIGLDVSGNATDGSPASGVVTGVLLSSSGTPDLLIGATGEQIQLTSVTQVQQAAPSSGDSTTQDLSTPEGSAQDPSGSGSQ